MSIFPFFERVAELHVLRYVKPTWRQKYPRHLADPWDSLRVFLSAYAFEHQGRPQDFPFAALDAIDEVRNRGFDGRTAQRVWKSFRTLLEEKNLNHAVNPLCPSKTKYWRKYRGNKRRAEVSEMSAIEFACSEIRPEPMTAWAKSLMEKDRVREAHEALKRINGVGDKIASLFLRDAAVEFGLKPPRDRALLQPIDTWIRFAVNSIADANLKDMNCADYIVDHSASPERANQGIWYFCAQVCKSSQYVVRKGLSSPAERQSLVQQHLDSMKVYEEISARLKRDCAEFRGRP